MGHRPRPTRFHRQRRLGAIQRSYLSLLIESGHHRPLRRVHIQADDIDQLLLEAAVAGLFEGVHPPRLQLVITPNASDGVLADPEPLRVLEYERELRTSGTIVSPLASLMGIAPHGLYPGWDQWENVTPIEAPV